MSGILFDSPLSLVCIEYWSSYCKFVCLIFLYDGNFQKAFFFGAMFTKNKSIF